MNPSTRRRLVIIAVALVLAALALLAEALPGYLAYADKPVKADAVVLFIGREYRARMKEARTLIAEGYADRLIIPAYGRLLGTKEVAAGNGNGQEKIPAPVVDLDKLEDDVRKMRARSPHYRSFFENTHVEVLEAKRIMDRHGFRSALFVSSPYHMRRIRMIAGDVFDPAQYAVSFIPTRFEKWPESLFDRTTTQFILMTQESLKILWFQAYRLWPEGLNG
ncbi:MAG TPA: ElyC/SanA/YdcF family protein [Syntrophales bacterium]|nr:ElyC/SanA/YdcF family protein [Syntrophales bacterium]